MEIGVGTRVQVVAGHWFRAMQIGTVVEIDYSYSQPFLVHFESGPDHWLDERSFRRIVGEQDGNR